MRQRARVPGLGTPVRHLVLGADRHIASIMIHVGRASKVGDVVEPRQYTWVRVKIRPRV